MRKLPCVDDVKTAVLDARDKITIGKIGDSRKSPTTWKPRKRTPQCVGCFHADIHVISVQRNNYWSMYGVHETNELSIYCNKKGRIVQLPWEICRYRLEKPKVPIDAWQIHL